MIVENYICIDIETTGLSYRNGHEIIEIAGAEVKNGVISESYSTLVKPENDIPEIITNIIGIDNNMVKGQPCASSAINKFLNIFDLIDKKKNIIFHNANFDYNFILYYTHYNFQSCWEPHNVICTLKLAKDLYPNESHKLDDLKKKFGIKSKGHRALNDVLSTIKVYEHMKEEMEARILKV